ncbi:MAG: hydrogenase expression/formation protein HypE [Burkholderiales bacterium]|nr:MAG: hydrogenase expression/formation protein HypE [Burkholderiales bacterium]
MSNEVITLAHGNGGRRMQALIREVVARALGDVLVEQGADATVLDARQLGGATLMMSSDSFTVQPLFFPGGDIGSLAVHGSVNDLAVCGAQARYLSLNLLIEEGLEIAVLERAMSSLAAAARQAGVQVACGDTKVVPRGHGGGLYISCSGVGVRADVDWQMARICAGDVLLVSGPVGDHGVAVMLAREAFGMSGQVLSDSADVGPLCRALHDVAGVRFLRDPTRGGLATVMHEIVQGTGLGCDLEQAAIPLRPAVASVCEMLGYEALYLACEGRVVAAVSADAADEVLARWRALPGGGEAAVIGRVVSEHRQVQLVTELGGRRLLAELDHDPLPRIC